MLGERWFAAQREEKSTQKTQEKERVPKATLTKLKQAFPGRWDLDEQGFIFIFVCLGKRLGVGTSLESSWPMVGAQVNICEMNE